MMEKPVRVRFAPSPTGGLHLGGVRTALYNYLFAKKHGGTFILRIEDTDQGRYVEGAEQYIIDCLEWCGIGPDEGPHKGGTFGPYRQSERKERYLKYAQKLVADGVAYYAFDTPQELEAMREKFKSEQNPSPQYNASIRMEMKNSISLPSEEVEKLIKEGVPYVIRIKVPSSKNISLNDMIRGEVTFNTDQLDDKVLLKADGMPTYHLAVVVDDYEMKITHAFRGEEWLPSSPIHVLLWEYLGWKNEMPKWAHLPLILKPDGKGKLSKRDGDRLGFPVFAMDWKDPKTNETTKGFREMGFLPEAFINMLALLGWNDGSNEEVADINQLISRFSIERIHKGGAKFDFEKAKWFNGEWIKRSSEADLLPLVKIILNEKGIHANDEKIKMLIGLVKERCQLLYDFYEQTSYFFESPKVIDATSVKPKWDDKKNIFFTNWMQTIAELSEWSMEQIENSFKADAAKNELKTGELQLPFRIMLVGGKFGPPVFEIAQIIGKEETIKRIAFGLKRINELS
jgi:glutamyl-tRNA synthetase